MRPLFHLAAAAVLAGAAYGHAYDVGPIHIDHPTAAPTAPGQPNGAAYLTIETKGPAGDRLVSLSSPIATAVEMHSEESTDGVMSMKKLDAVAIEPGAVTAFQPGGTHIMLIGLKAPLKAGDTAPLTMTFEKAGSVTVELHIEKPGDAAKPMDGMKM